MKKAQRLNLGLGRAIALSGGRMVKHFPVLDDGGALLVFEKPGKRKRCITTRVRLSADAFLAVGALCLTANNAQTRLALAGEVPPTERLPKLPYATARGKAEAQKDRQQKGKKR